MQCKATKKQVGPGVVREPYGTMQAMGSQEGILATVGGATKGARAFAASKRIRILDLDAILALQEQRQVPAGRVYLTPETDDP